MCDRPTSDVRAESARELPEDLVSIVEAARLVVCSPGCVRRWALSGRVRCWKRCGRLFVSRAEVLGLFKEQRPAQPPPPVERRQVEPAWVLETLRKAGYRI